MAAPGFSGGGLPPRPSVAAPRRRPFVAPHARPTSIPLDANLLRGQGPSPGGGGGGRMPSSGGGGNGLPRRLPNDPPPLVPRVLSFTEPHAATWNAGSTTTSPAEVYEVAGGDFSPHHWMPDYSFQAQGPQVQHQQSCSSQVTSILQASAPCRRLLPAAAYNNSLITSMPADEAAADGLVMTTTTTTTEQRQQQEQQPRASSYFTNMMEQEVDDDLELLNQPDATPSTGGKGASKRGSNYSNVEDIQLCKSWIHISNDLIIGNGQSGKTYWERIANDFHKNRDFESDRSANSLEHRFGIILKECMKFQGYYEEVEHRHPSGIPYQEHLLEAQARYARKAKGKNCQFEHWWLTLRHTQKFESTLEGNKRPTKSRELNLSVASQQEDESTAQGQESSSFPSAKKARPPGRKQSKENLKRNEGDDEYKDMMQTLIAMKAEEHKMKKERWDKDMMLEQRRLAMEERRLDMESFCIVCCTSGYQFSTSGYYLNVMSV